MNRSLCLAVSFLALFSKAQSVETVVFSEDFNDITAISPEWTTYDRDRDGSSWELSQGSDDVAQAGWDSDDGNMLSVLSYVFYPFSMLGPMDSDDVVISPAIKIPETGDINLSYKIGVPFDYLAGKKVNDISYQLFVIEDGQPFYPTLKPLDETRFSNSSKAEHRLINLNDYRGKTVKLYWRQYDTFDQFILLLDDIKITQISTNPSTIAPNPVDDILYLKGFSTTPSYKIYNLAGRLIKSGVGESADVRYLATGMYVIVVEDQGKEAKSFKFYKK